MKSVKFFSSSQIFLASDSAASRAFFSLRLLTGLKQSAAVFGLPPGALISGFTVAHA
jgi:hypothetical protein